MSRRFARSATGLVAAPVLAFALLAPTASIAAPAVAAETSVGEAKVKQTKSCASRTVNPRKPIAPKTFAKCAVTAMKKSRTVRIRTAYDDGSWASGPYRFGKGTDASVNSNTGLRHVALGKDFWMKNPGEGWVKGRKNGDADEQLAYGTGQLWRANSSAAVYTQALRSSTTKWKWTGVERKINGVKARRYTGTPRIKGMKFSEYSVWLDKQYRPIRVTSTGTAFGYTISMKQDFTKWGKKVSITPPRVR